MVHKQKNEIIEIFSGTSWEVGMVKSLLDNAEIKSFLKEEIMGTLNPWHTVAGGAGSIKIIINSIDYDRAKLIIEEYSKSQRNK